MGKKFLKIIISKLAHQMSGKYSGLKVTLLLHVMPNGTMSSRYDLCEIR